MILVWAFIIYFPSIPHIEVQAANYDECVRLQKINYKKSVSNCYLTTQ